jgi:hypothetical protein
MIERREFHPLQAEEIARAFNEKGVDYLFIGKSGAILLGYPGTTQDVDIFPERSAENGRRIVAALRQTGFEIPPELESEIVAANAPADARKTRWTFRSLRAFAWIHFGLVVRGSSQAMSRSVGEVGLEPAGRRWPGIRGGCVVGSSHLWISTWPSTKDSAPAPAW